MNPHHDPRTRLTGTTSTRLHDWETWLGLSSTPPTRPGTDPLHELWVHAGTVVEPGAWPTGAAPRIYAALDDVGVVYVGQTTRPLLWRIRNHFGNQRTDAQRRKAGTWQLIVAAVFDDPLPGSLDRRERSAAEWLLHLSHRAGRRHPRQP